MAKQVNIHYAKTHLSRLLEEAEKGEEIVIARAGKPVVKLVAVQKLRPREFGQDRGKIQIPDDFDEPDEEIIRMFEGDDEEDPAR
ncbi:MAG: type II toxin-antitoxin system Phd/YefM family antitoxin [Myxococcales bacterium]